MSTPYENPWSDPYNVDLLMKLHKEGLSCAQISHRIPNTTRNAVIGKLHRMGIKSHDGAHKRAREYKARSSQKPKPKQRPTARDRYVKCIPASQPLPVSGHGVTATKTFATLNPNRDCRYIPGDPQGAGPIYCGQPAEFGLPYCARCASFLFTGFGLDRRRDPLDPSRPYQPIKSKEHA